jgi:dTDP-4-amino-4,6-dideoxygalactose transaminase
VAHQIITRLIADNDGRRGRPATAPWQRPALKSTLVSKPALNESAVAYVEDVLRSGWWGYGPVAQHLQATIESLYDGRQNALATSSCTAAMHLALRASGVGPGDEVIVPAFTYVSTAVGAVYCGAEPVFADIDPATLTLSAETVAPLLSPRTRAIIPMHYAGPPADFDPIRELVAGRNITVIEDAAHAFGSVRDGERVGAGAEFTAFSFAPTKQIASSNGGILLYRDGERRTEINQLAFLGLAADTYNRTVAQGVSPTQMVARIGHKYKIDDLAAAVAFASIECLDEIVAQRAALVDRYYHQLEGVDEIELMPRRTNAAISWYIMPIRVPAEKRDGLRAQLAARNIDSTVHYPNLLEQPAFQHCRGDVPVTARETRRVISLPLHQAILPSEVDRICDTVRAYLR